MSLLARILAGRPDRFPNPLFAGDPDFACRCDTHRDTCRASLVQWSDSYGDEPGFSTDPTERATAVLGSCARVYAILSRNAKVFTRQGVCG
jgi:hypothetical protein